MTAEQVLKPGDVLLYWTNNSVYGWLIALKTWHKVSHVETYVGDGKSIASRNGIGVGTYPLRLDGLICVRRPEWAFDLQKVLDWQRTVDGYGYDFDGLLYFIAPDYKDKPDRAMICSEHATWAARISGGEPFDAGEPADRIAPFEFLVSPSYTSIAWRE